MEIVPSHTITKYSVTTTTDNFIITGITTIAITSLDLNTNTSTSSTDTNLHSTNHHTSLAVTTADTFITTNVTATTVTTSVGNATRGTSVHHFNTTSINHNASSVASTSNPLLLLHGVTTITTTSVVDLSIIATTIHTSSVNTNSHSDSHKASLATRYQDPNVIGVTTTATTAGPSITAITTFSRNPSTLQYNDRDVFTSIEVLISIVSVVAVITITIITVVVVGIVVCHKRRKRRRNDDYKPNPKNKPESVKQQDCKDDSPKGPDPIYACYPKTKSYSKTCVEVYAHV